MSSSPETLSPILPSVFELLAQERLTKFVRSGLHQTLKLLQTVSPSSSSWKILYQYKDELVLLLEGILQWFYLHCYSALAGEHYYGLRRTSDYRLRSLIVSVLLPYIKLKLQSLEKRLRSSKTDPRMKWSFVIQILPKIQIVLEVIGWLYRLSYGFGLSNYYSPSLQLASAQLTYAKEPSPLIPQPSVRRNVISLISQIISYGLFCIQLIDWWNNLNASDDSLLTIPSNKPMNLAPGQRPCWLCRQGCRETTSILGSGYVYCHSCITDYITRFHRCPVSHQPVTHEHLVRLV